MVAEQISIGDEELKQTLEARNMGDEPFELTTALHTYIAMSSIDKVWPELKHHSCALHNREVHTGAVHQAKGSDDAEVQPGRPLLLCLKLQSNCLTARAVHVTSLRLCGAKWGLDDKQGLHVQAHVVGLKGVEYMDSLQDRKRLTEQGDSITFSEELDRIYLSTPDTLEVCPAQLLPVTFLQISWQAVHSSELGSLRACSLEYFACSIHSWMAGQDTEGRYSTW